MTWSGAPDEREEVCDAYLRFLWDLAQFYRQLRPTWYDRHALNVSKEDWIVYRIKDSVTARGGALG